MKAWVLAVVLSIGLHLVLVASCRGAAVAVVAAAPRERVVDGVVEFTPVVEAPVVVARPVARPVPVQVEAPLVLEMRELIRDPPGADLGMEGPPEGETVASVVSGENVEAPHPDPLPRGGEGDGVAADVVALVHARLAAMAEGCYPAAARRFQQRGTVQLSFCLDAQGAAASTSVTQSSGAELLDSAAQGCVVQKAAPFPLEAASRCFSVPVRFGAR